MGDLFGMKTSRVSIWATLIVCVILESIGVLSNWKILILLDEGSSQSSSRSFLRPPPSLFATPKVTEKVHPQVVFMGSKVYHNNSMHRSIPQDENILSPSEGWHKHPQPNERIPILGNPLQLDGSNGTQACVASDWQSKFYPTCNAFHETEFIFEHQDATKLEFLGNGQQRDAWKLTHQNESVVLKTLRIKQGSFAQLTFHRQMIDSIISEKLTSSPYVIDVYGYCGMSAINEMGVEYNIKERLTYKERIQYASHVAHALADLHQVGSNDIAHENKYPMIAHGDLRRGNVMFSKDKSVLKLHDFNQASFMGYNTQTNQPCGFQRIGQGLNLPPRRDKFSAPEESHRNVLTAKTDIYHLGSILFYIMTGGKPYLFNKDSDLDESGNPPLTDQWLLPELPPDKQHHTDPAIVSLKNAMYACYRVRAENRPTANQVHEMLHKTIVTLK